MPNFDDETMDAFERDRLLARASERPTTALRNLRAALLQEARDRGRNAASAIAFLQSVGWTEERIRNAIDR